MALTKKQEEEKAKAKRLQRSKNYYANMKDQERATKREAEDKNKPGPRMSQNQARKMEAEKNKINNPTKKVKKNIVKKNVPSLKSLGLESKPQESDLARLKRQDKERKAFESEALSRKKAQTSKLKDPLIERAKKSIAKYDSPKQGKQPKNQKPVSQVQKKDAKILSSLDKHKKPVRSPKIGFTPKAFSIKGAPGPAGKKLKRLSSGGEVKASKYYSGGGTVFTGR